MQTDILIIGGGFAGLGVASQICTNSDLKVTLLEKGEIGDESKTSSVTFMNTLNEFNLNSAILQPYTKYSFRSESGLSACYETSKPILALINYRKASEILLKKAMLGNFELYEKTPAINFSVDGEEIVVATQEHVLSTKILVDATGNAFFCGKKLEMKLPSFFQHSYGYAFKNSDIKLFNDFCLFGGDHSPGGGWFYPGKDGIAKFGTCVGSKNPNFPENTLKDYLKYLIKYFKPYNSALKNAQTLRVEKGTIPIGCSKKLVNGRVMFIGDSAGMATPWGSEGLRPALETSILCAKSIINAFENEKYFDSNILEYQNQWNNFNKKVYNANISWSKVKYKLGNSGWDAIIKKYHDDDVENVINRIKTGESINITKLIKIKLLLMKLNLNSFFGEMNYESRQKNNYKEKSDKN
jgi:flavin-dependent dehydrogenase